MGHTPPEHPRSRRKPPLPQDVKPVVLVRVGVARATFVRVVLGFVVVCTGVLTAVCLDLAGPGLVVAAATREDRLVGLIFSPILLGCLIGALVYPRRYVLEMLRHGDRLDVRCLGVVVPQTFRVAVAEVRGVSSHDDWGRAGAAPFSLVRTGSGTFIVDHRGEHVDNRALHALSVRR